MLPLQPGDVPDTWADSTRLARATGWRPRTSVKEGVRHFAKWYQTFYPPSSPAPLAGRQTK